MYVGAEEEPLHEHVFLGDRVFGLATRGSSVFVVFDGVLSDQAIFELERFLVDNGELPLGHGEENLNRVPSPPTDAEIDQLVAEAIGVVALRPAGAAPPPVVGASPQEREALPPAAPLRGCSPSPSTGTASGRS